MADPDNSGQFGNRPDTEEQAEKGGEASSGSFGAPNGADPAAAGAQGGQNSGGGQNSNDDSDTEEDEE